MLYLCIPEIAEDPILSTPLYPRAIEVHPTVEPPVLKPMRPHIPLFNSATQTATGVSPHSWQAAPAPPTTGIHTTCTCIYIYIYICVCVCIILSGRIKGADCGPNVM